MRNLKGSTKVVTPKKATKAAKKVGAKETGKQTKTTSSKVQESEELTAYERLYQQVEEKRRKREQNTATDSDPTCKQARSASPAELVSIEHVQFTEEDNVMDMMVGEQQDAEFPSQSEDESEDGEILDTEPEDSFNNNAAIARAKISAQGSQHAVRNDLEQRPPFLDELTCTSGFQDTNTTTATGNNDLNKTLEVMQNYMMKKGIINSSMTTQELQNFLLKEVEGTAAKNNSSKRTNRIEPIKCVVSGSNHGSSTSEVTIYKRAVRQLAPELEEQIDQFIADTRKSDVGIPPPANQTRKVSSSSEELMDTSDEIEINNGQGLNFSLISAAAKVQEKERLAEPPQQEHSDEMIREAERSKAQVFDTTGRDMTNSIMCRPMDLIAMDNDYQMVDTHLDESLKRKILNLEYVDFARLLKNRSNREDDSRLEFVNKNGMTFLSPVSDREGLQISSHGRWEQAFRVFSNVLTTKFPHKAPELLQYAHTISTVSSAYIWENIYAYDKEFCHHIEWHPTRAWNVILQQAWTMLLKDRLRSDGGFKRNDKGRKEPCRRFNKG